MLLAAIASNALKPKLSYSLVSKKMSLTFIISSICSCFPTKLTSFAMPKCLARSSAAGRSGPSPTIISFAGISFRTSAKTFTTSSTRFTFLKLLACSNIFSPLGAITFLNASIGFFAKRATSTKFVMTSISFVIAKFLYVSSFKFSLTDVMVSLSLIEKVTTGS